MRRAIVLAITTVLLGLCAVGILAFRDDIAFYFGLYKAYRTGKRFYAEYEHLSRDVVFDPDMEPRLDVYSPPSGNGYPVLIFVHGGGWKDYDKELFAPVAMRLLPEGMVVVIPDYTLYPDAGYEQMASEVAAALSWTLENIEQYRGDPHHVVIAGHSAGGHLSGLVVMDPQFLGVYGHSGSEVSGLVGMSGVYDIQAEYDFWDAQGAPPQVMTEVMGGQQNFPQASPLSHVKPGLPPVLLIHGDKDETVPMSIATAFDSALQAAGVESELLVYAGAEHTDYLFAALSEERARVVADIADFVRLGTATIP